MDDKKKRIKELENAIRVAETIMRSALQDLESSDKSHEAIRDWLIVYGEGR